MTGLSWGSWTDTDWVPDDENPYVNWWNQTEAPTVSLSFKEIVRVFSASHTIPQNTAIDPKTATNPRTIISGQSVTSPTPVRQPDLPGYGTEHPLRDAARNPGYNGDKWIPAPEELRTDRLEKETVIVGIIDDGISYCHEEFMHPQNPQKTRILAAWQQDARWAGPTEAEADALASDGTKKQPYLPFGREYYQHDIQELMADVSRNGNFDQDAFNRAAGVVEMTDPEGPRALANRVGHGTHVADLAAGGTEMALMFANLPNRSTVGLSGTFLEYYFLTALLRMINLADAQWTRDHAQDHDGSSVRGYGMVFNLSFSKSAGARDAISGIAREVVKINEDRKECDWSRIYLSLPAGNDNLLEGIAELTIKSGKVDDMTLEVVPEDQSPSFVEIWTNQLGEDASIIPKGLEIEVTPPGLVPDGLSIAPLPLSPMAAKMSGRDEQPAPLPGFARPTGPVETDPLIRLTWMPDADNAIVGVIDSGIALSHARFRRLDGGTRFLSAWLQGGTWREESAVPFGRELFRTEIDQLMFRAVSAGALDEREELFVRDIAQAVGLVVWRLDVLDQLCQRLEVRVRTDELALGYLQPASAHIV